MNQSEDPAIRQMQDLIQQWEMSADRKVIFLRCYQMMTGNMLAAIERNEFQDSHWVDQLLHHFADYYFVALAQYEKDPALTPRVWHLAHEAARDLKVSPFQLLILGVNAHINYDLVLTLADILGPEWATWTETQQRKRYADHCHVNEVIGQTIDAVQDQILEPAMPALEIFDKFLGPVDEYLISGLISHWRETVWQNAVQLLKIDNNEARKSFIQQVEAETLRLGNLFI